MRWHIRDDYLRKHRKQDAKLNSRNRAHINGIFYEKISASCSLQSSSAKFLRAFGGGLVVAHLLVIKLVWNPKFALVEGKISATYPRANHVRTDVIEDMLDKGTSFNSATFLSANASGSHGETSGHMQLM